MTEPRDTAGNPIPQPNERIGAMTDGSHPDTAPKTPKCVCCGADVPDYEPEYCCSGKDCGCGGGPIEPPLCANCPPYDFVPEPPTGAASEGRP